MIETRTSTRNPARLPTSAMSARGSASGVTPSTTRSYAAPCAKARAPKAPRKSQAMFHLEILEKLPPRPHERGPRGGYSGYAARFRVKCPQCRDVYITSCSPCQIRRTPRCRTCDRRRRGLNPSMSEQAVRKRQPLVDARACIVELEARIAYLEARPCPQCGLGPAPSTKACTVKKTGDLLEGLSTSEVAPRT